MARISERVKGYPMGKCTVPTTYQEVFYTVEECLNTLFDIMVSTRKKWGDKWYEYARFGCYHEARLEVISKPDCVSKTVAIKCINDLETLRKELKALDSQRG